MDIIRNKSTRKHYGFQDIRNFIKTENAHWDACAIGVRKNRLNKLENIFRMASESWEDHQKDGLDILFTRISLNQ